MGLSAPGAGTGLDVSGIVNKLVNADIAPAKNRLEQKATSVSTNITVLGQIKGVLGKLQASLNNLYNLSTFYTMKSTTSDPDHFNAITTEKANPGVYNIEVEQMAQSHSLSSQPTVNPSLGTGTLTIQLGTYSADKTSFTNNPTKPPIIVNITSGNESLQRICDAINKDNPGIQANIIQDTQGSRITITSTETGEPTAMQITVSNNSGNTLSTLGYDPTAGIGNMTETNPAQNSKIKVNGIELINTSNNLKEAITGITINLKKAELGKVVTLTLDNDKQNLTNLVKDFIKQYNDAMSTLNNVTGYDAETETAGILQSDSGIQSLKSKLASWATEPMKTGNTAVSSLVDLGIKTDSKGLLVMDETKFNALLESNYKDIGALFAKTATTTDGNIQVTKMDKTVKAGTYNVFLDTYIPGTSMTGSIGGITATSGNGTTLSGTGELLKLSMDILGGIAGSRGSVTINDGLAVRLDTLLDSYLNDKGDLTQKVNQLNKHMKTLNTENDALIARAGKLEARLLKQFNALDAVLAKLQASTGMLDQLNNLPKIQ